MIQSLLFAVFPTYYLSRDSEKYTRFKQIDRQVSTKNSSVKETEFGDRDVCKGTRLRYLMREKKGQFQVNCVCMFTEYRKIILTTKIEP